MSDDINYKNSPLHGVGLKTLLTEMVEHYGFEILHAYLNLNCFKTKPTIESSVKFLKKTDWAREKVEAFYMYQYKNLPRASKSQFELSPRDRIVPEDQKPGEPAELSLEDAARLREKQAAKAAEFGRGNRRQDSHQNNRQDRNRNHRSKSSSSSTSTSDSSPSKSNDGDPWAAWR